MRQPGEDGMYRTEAFNLSPSWQHRPFLLLFPAHAALPVEVSLFLEILQNLVPEFGVKETVERPEPYLSC